MPGLFGIFTKIDLSRDKKTDYFLSMGKALNFFNYDLKFYTNAFVSIGTIGPGPRQEPLSFVLHGKEYVGLIDGHIFSVIDKTSDKIDLIKVYKTIVGAPDKLDLNFIRNINGEFNIFIYNCSDNELLLITDRFGLKKIYITETDKCIFFFPDIYAINVLPQIERKLDLECLAQHICFTHPTKENTFLKSIIVAPNGSVMRFSRREKGISTIHYWDWDLEKTLDISNIEECADEVYDKLTSAIWRRVTIAHGKTCVSLSGGLDSRSLVYLLVRNGKTPDTVTYGYKDSLECKIAKKVARTLNLNNKHIGIDNDYVFSVLNLALKFTDGSVPALQLFHLYAINKYCNDLKSCPFFHFSGFYGDAILGAHFFDSEIVNKLKISNSDLKRLIFNRSAANFPMTVLPSLFTDEFYRIIRESINQFVDTAIYEMNKKRDVLPLHLLIDRFFILYHARRYLSSTSFFNFYMYDTRPFFDYDLFEFYMSIPADYRFDHRLYSLIYNRHMMLVGCIPYNKTGRPVGEAESFLFRKRRQFARNINYYLSRLSNGRLIFNERYNYVQFGKWFHSIPSLIEKATKLLLENRTLDRGILDPKGVEKLYLDYRKGKWVGSVILNLYFLELWMRMYIDCTDVEIYSRRQECDNMLN